MASNNRATQINKVLKIVKKHFQPVEIPAERTLLEHLIYACCAENSLHNVANEVFTTLSAEYFDWNEVRVTSIRELADVMKPLNDPKESATRLKRVLQSVFETHYSFDLEPMKKQNIGQTVKQMDKYNGTTRYTVAFVTQNALGGHAIPINLGLLESMRVVGVISDNEAKKGSVPGLERAVPKSKGVELGTILHQLGVELHRSPYGPTIRKLLLEIEPTCKDNLPKRPSKKVEKPSAEKPTAKTTGAEKPAKQKSTAKEQGKKSVPKAAPKSAKKPVANTAKATKKKPLKKKVVKKKVVKKKVAKKTATKKKKPVKKKAVTKKKTTTKKKHATAAGKGKKKSATKKINKRKPR
jgi:endonuclease-3